VRDSWVLEIILAELGVSMNNLGTKNDQNLELLIKQNGTDLGRILF